MTGFGPWAETGVLAERQAFVLDGDGAPAATTAWFHDANPTTTTTTAAAAGSRRRGGARWRPRALGDIVPSFRVGNAGPCSPRCFAACSSPPDSAASRVSSSSHTQAARAIAMHG